MQNFRNDCDEIRPKLRNQLLRDSKLCQLEQMKEYQKRQEVKSDFDDAWHTVLSRDHQQKLEREKALARNRCHEGLSVQDFQKLQMADKKERSLKVWEEINEERKQLARMSKEDYEIEQERLRDEQKQRKSIDEEISVRKLHTRAFM